MVSIIMNEYAAPNTISAIITTSIISVTFSDFRTTHYFIVKVTATGKTARQGSNKNRFAKGR